MTLDYSSPTRYWYTRHQGYEARSQRRLQIDLGFDEAVTEVILHLRGQVIKLQALHHRLEVELAAQTASQELRLAHYHNFYYETNGIDLDFRE